MQLQEDEYFEAKTQIDQLAKVLLGSQHKFHLIVGLVQNPLLYPIHLLRAPLRVTRRQSYMS